MKKIFLAVLTVAMTACVSEEGLTPVDNYGTLRVNVNNDQTVQTREVKEVSDLSTWTLTYKATSGETEEKSITGTSIQVPAGTYTVSAKSHASLAKAYEGYGAAYYEGTSSAVTIVAGGSETATIACGTAQNARISAVFPETTIISNCSLALTTKETDADDYRAKGVTLDYDNLIAYYVPERSVNYTLSYTYKTETTPKSVSGTIKLGVKATDTKVTVTPNTNGTIAIKVTYNDTFTSVDGGTITIDAVTGLVVGA